MLQLLEGPAPNTYSPWKEACSSLPYSFSSAFSYQTSRPPKDPVCRTSWPNRKLSLYLQNCKKPHGSSRGFPEQGAGSRSPKPGRKERQARGRSGARGGKQAQGAPPPPQARLRENLQHRHAPLAFVRQPASLPGLSQRLCRATCAGSAARLHAAHPAVPGRRTHTHP